MAEFKFKEVRDPMTEVFINEAGSISIAQPEEDCASCGASDVAVVVMSAKRARDVARALLSLADELSAQQEAEDA